MLERAPALAEVGAGIQIAPNGARILDALDITVDHVVSEAIHLIDGPTGRSLIRMRPPGDFRMCHRADLIAALRDAAIGAGADLRLDATVERITPDSIVLGSERVPRERLIGSDGARGAARAFVAPKYEGRFTGQVAWRAMVPAPPDWPREAQIHVGPGRHLVVYPLRGGTVLNLVGVEERTEWAAEDWSQEDDPANLRTAFAGYSDGIRSLLAAVDSVHLWGLMDHGVTEAWTRDGVTLIGDAAHPTLPFLAQGANLALEDAFLIARHLDDPAAYEALRRPRVTRALAAAADNARNYHLRGARARAAHVALRMAARVAPDAMAARYRWLYEYDATAG